jgi:hypothetical protein
MGSRPGSSVLPGEYLPLDRGEEGIDTRELPPTEEGGPGADRRYPRERKPNARATDRASRCQTATRAGRSSSKAGGFVKPRPRRGGSCPAPLRLGGFGGTAVSGKPVRDRPNDPLSEKGQEVFLKYELGEAGCLALEGPASSKEEHDLFLEGRIEYDWQAGVPPSAHPEPRPVSALRVGVLGDAALAAAPRSALAAVRAVADRPLAPQ